MNYKLFKEEYESSGMNQKGFSKLKGISPSMVSYYLSKARELAKAEPGVIDKERFFKIDVIKKSISIIRIRTSQGVEIEIPV